MSVFEPILGTPLLHRHPLSDSYSPATRVVAPANSGFSADYYTDGTADDVEINAALTAINALGGGTLLLKAGTYTITASLAMYQNEFIIGEGTGSTIIKVANNVNSVSMHAITVNAINNIGISKLQVDGNKANQSSGGHGIRLDNGCIGVIIEDIYIHDTVLHNLIFKDTGGLFYDAIYVDKLRLENAGTNADGSGLYLGNVNDIVISNINSSGHQLDGIQWKTSDKIEVSNVNCHDNLRYGVYITYGHTNISNVNAYNNQIGINIEPGTVATTANISNAEVYNNSSDGVRIADSSYINLTNVNSWNNGQGGGTHAGLKLTIVTNGNSVTYCNVTNCKFYDLQGSPTQTFGIWANGTGTIDNNYIVNNLLFGNSNATQFRKDTWGLNNIDAFNVSGIILPGNIVQTIKIDRSSSGVGSGLTVSSGGAASGATNSSGGSLNLTAGTSTGSARSNILLSVPSGGSSGATDNVPTSYGIFFARNGLPAFSISNISGSTSNLILNAVGNMYLLGGENVGFFGSYRNTTSNTAGKDLTIFPSSATLGATNKNSGSLILSSGVPTGTGTGQVKFQTAPARASGEISTISINAGGSGYVVNDVLTITGGGGTGGTATVLTVDGSGVILTISLTTFGSGYAVTTGAATTGGTGTSATINILTINANDSTPVVVMTLDGTGKLSLTGTEVITSNSAISLTVGPNGSTNPVLKVDSSFTGQVNGIVIKGDDGTTGAQITVISSNTDENLILSAQGSGLIKLNSIASFGSPPQIVIAGAANTSFDGVLLYNSNFATAGNQSYSPRLRLTGFGWKTDATAGSQQADWVIENQPVQGTANPTTNLVFKNQVNGSGYVSTLTILGSGKVQLTNLISTYNNIATVSNGIPSELATIDTTGLTANVGASTLYAVPASGAGMYRVSVYVVETTAGSLSSTLPNAQIVFTDNDTGGSITIDATPILGIAGIGQTGALTANTVGTAASGVIVINVKASTTIQYQTVNYASNLAGMTYAIHLKLESL